MNEFTVTACPTLTNPEAFDTLADLRQALTRANADLLDLAGRLQDQTALTENVCQSFFTVIKAYVIGDEERVSELLDAFAQRFTAFLRAADQPH